MSQVNPPKSVAWEPVSRWAEGRARRGGSGNKDGGRDVLEVPLTTGGPLGKEVPHGVWGGDVPKIVGPRSSRRPQDLGDPRSCVGDLIL